MSYRKDTFQASEQCLSGSHLMTSMKSHTSCEGCPTLKTGWTDEQNDHMILPHTYYMLQNKHDTLVLFSVPVAAMPRLWVRFQGNTQNNEQKSVSLSLAETLYLHHY